MPSAQLAKGLMKTPQSLLPDARTLAAGLAAGILGKRPDGRMTILGRKPPFMMSTFPNEVVTCRLPGGEKQRVFIKYEGGCSHNSFGHRGGIGYEAEVYRRLLQRLPDFRPRFLGSHVDGESGGTWLFLEYVDGAVRVRDIGLNARRSGPPPLLEVARWIGRFHRAHEAPAAAGEFPFVHRYDAAYYRGWARRTSEFARPLQARFPWLGRLRWRSGRWMAPLLEASPTVIHGEFYARTVLTRGRRLYCVDWESAAVGAGEIDLAALTEGRGWPRELVGQCERAYESARWPGEAPSNFRRTLDSARLYLQFRWLGERPDWTMDPKNLWRFRELRTLAERLTMMD